MITYLLIIIIFWMLVLTFFVVKLTDKEGKLENKENALESRVKDLEDHDDHEKHIITREANLKKVITNIHKEKEENLDELAKKVDDMLASKSRNEIEEWIKTDIKQEPSGSMDLKNSSYIYEHNKLPNLNEGYKTY